VGGPGDPQALYDVDVGDDIIVRCHRKIVYPNGTIYSGFVDCGFECMQKQHRCVNADDMQLIATGHSMRAIDAAFEREAEDSKTQLFNNEISRQSNLTSSQQLVVIKIEPEDESPGLAGDDEFDRWTDACAKCGQSKP